MKSVLFDPEGANSLNTLVQTMIAPHLFIVCNYNVDAFPLISEDARFLQGILNLYKFTIDASLINRIKSIDKNLGRKTYYSHRDWIIDLESYLETISCLRTFSSHNNFHNETEEKTEKWIIKILKKKSFETMEDYTKGVKELENIGNNICQIVTNIITYMANEYSKQKLQEVWEESILSFYNNDGHRLIKEEMRLAFLSQNCGISYDVNDFHLGNWCRKIFIDDLKDQVKMLSSYLPKSHGDQKNNLEAEINRLNSRIAENEKKIAKYVGVEPTDLKVFDYLSYYCWNFSKKCKPMLPEVINRKLTMLPQDMVQYIISLDFRV